MHHKHFAVNRFFLCGKLIVRPWAHQNYQWIYKIWYLPEVTEYSYHVFSSSPYSHLWCANPELHKRLNTRTHQIHFTCLRAEHHCWEIMTAQNMWHNRAETVMFAILFYSCNLPSNSKQCNKHCLLISCILCKLCNKNSDDMHKEASYMSFASIFYISQNQK